MKTILAAAAVALALAASQAGAQTSASAGTTAATDARQASPARQRANRAAPQPGRTARTPTNAETTAGVAAAEDDNANGRTTALTSGLPGSEATQGRGGEWGVAPGSGRIGEPGAISMGVGSTGGDSIGSTSPGQSAGGMMRTVTPPGSPPAR